MSVERVMVGDSEGGQRLDRLLAHHLAALSRTRLKRLVEAGHVRLDGTTTNDPSRRVRPGQIVLVDVPAPIVDRPLAQAIALDIAYEDEHVIVIDKPAGMVIHPAPGNADQTLVNALLAHCGETLAGIGGVKRPGIVHRLDKDTSGLVVAAKTDVAHRELSRAFAAREITRSYVAVVRGVPSPRQGTIATRIGRSKSNRKKMAVLEHGGKEAVTSYRVLRAFGTAGALLECRLATGRTHQIRVHLAATRHPLIGDKLYGRSPGSSLPQEARDFPRQALHARTLGFHHPIDRRELVFSSQLPKDLEGLIKILELI